MSLKNENQLRIWNGKVPKTPVEILEVTTVPKNITAGESLTFIIKLNRYVRNFTLADIDFMAPPTLAGGVTNGCFEGFPENTWKLTYDISADFDDDDYNLYLNRTYANRANIGHLEAKKRYFPYFKPPTLPLIRGTFRSSA